MRPLAAVAAVAVVLAGCGDEEPPTASADGACDEVTHPPQQGGQHLVGDAEPPVPYSSTPPTSGWHASGRTPVTVQPPDEPLSEPRQVSVLEAGGAVVAYHDVPADERAALERHVRAQYADRVAVTPYDELRPGEVAFTAWGVLQRCDGVDTDALDAFVEAHAEGQPVEAPAEDLSADGH